MSQNNYVIVGLSGGVDSSVSAHLLKQNSQRVEALFMKNWVDLQGDGNCPIEKDLSDASSVSESLGLKFHVLTVDQNVDEKFKEIYLKNTIFPYESRLPLIYDIYYKTVFQGGAPGFDFPFYDEFFTRFGAK